MLWIQIDENAWIDLTKLSHVRIEQNTMLITENGETNRTNCDPKIAKKSLTDAFEPPRAHRVLRKADCNLFDIKEDSPIVDRRPEIAGGKNED